MEGYHKSVLVKEVLDILNIKHGSWYLDCTFGDGGHSLRVLKSGGKVIGLDVDPQAIGRAEKRLHEAGYSGQDFRLIQGNFRDLKNLIQKQTDIADQKIAGAIFDLGVSSLQLDSPERGFSFNKLGPLDMRMDPDLGVRALDLVNILSRKELYELFNSLGEEKYSKRLADTLVRAREVKKFETTLELAGLIERALGGRREKIHPATKVFQALRMVVNDELGALEEGLESVKDLIEERGRIIVISFHSLEDRMVKNTFKKWQEMSLGKRLMQKPVIPGSEEIYDNPRSRSAKMRGFEIDDYYKRNLKL